MSNSTSALPPKRVRVSANDLKQDLRIVNIPLASCQANPEQPRKQIDPANLQDLAHSIERHGLLQPITVMQNPKKAEHFLIVAGERRFRAFEFLEKQTIPAIITTGNADEIALIENLQREDLSAIEEAEALLRLKKKYAYTHEDLGQAIGKARSTISHLLKLNALPEQIKRESATSHKVSKSLLIEISKLKDTDLQLQFWEEAKHRGATVKEARAKKISPPPSKPKPTDIAKAFSKGHRFVLDLERMASKDRSLDPETYEQLLAIFKRFVSFMEQEASRQVKKA